jgi:hypothetical protein
MKSIIKILLIVLISFSFNSCDDAEELLDTKFNSQLSGDLKVVVPAEGAVYKSIEMRAVNFLGEETIDPRSDSQVNEYINKIKSFDVYEVTGTVVNVSAPVEIVNGTITVSDGSKAASWAVNNFNVINGASITLGNSDGQWDKIDQILGAKKVFTAKIEGTVDRGDVSFTIRILIKMKVVANPLN